MNFVQSLENNGGNMKNYVIFDLDGTLLDSMFVWKDAGAIFLREKGIEAPDDLYEQLKAMSLKQAAQYLNNRFQLSLSTSEIMEGIKGVVEKQYVNEVQLKPFVRECLEHMKACHKQMCIVTAAEYSHVEAALKRLGVWNCFEFVLTCSEVGSGKDNPIIFQLAAQEWGVTPQEVVVVEDALHAIETAKAAGFYTVGVYDESAKNDMEEIKRIADVFTYHLNKLSI